MDTETTSEELVEVEVVPQTVNEIIYLQEEDLEVFDDQTSLFMPVVTFDCNDDEENEEEIGSVPIDNEVLPYLTVTLQESQTDEEYEFKTDTENYVEDITLATSAVKCGINLYECKLCNKRFKSWKFVTSHVVTHGEEWKINLSKKQINCTQCRMTFDDPRSLTYHFQSHHDVPKSFICDICSCSFVSENGLAGHYKKHFHPKEFVCHICSAGYDSSIDIENHYKTHRTNLLYACNKCDAGFAGTVELSAHLRHAHPRIPVPKAATTESIFCPVSSSETIKTEITVANEHRTKEREREDVVKDEAFAKENSSECKKDCVSEETSKLVKKRGRPKKKTHKKTRKV